jgi:hypothetical protein
MQGVTLLALVPVVCAAILAAVWIVIVGSVVGGVIAAVLIILAGLPIGYYGDPPRPLP